MSQENAEAEATGPENKVSELDAQTHAEFIAIYEDASTNIRFAKEQQWRAVLYFMFGGIAATAYEMNARWSDEALAWFLLVIIWLFSIITAIVIICLQWWQHAEHRKIDYLTSKWSSYATAARRRKSKGASDVQRYFLLSSMLLLLELATFAITRIFMIAM